VQLRRLLLLLLRVLPSVLLRLLLVVVVVVRSMPHHAELRGYCVHARLTRVLDESRLHQWDAHVGRHPNICKHLLSQVRAVHGVRHGVVMWNVIQYRCLLHAVSVEWRRRRRLHHLVLVLVLRVSMKMQLHGGPVPRQLEKISDARGGEGLNYRIFRCHIDCMDCPDRCARYSLST
jgi:hypothetical protein